MARLLGFIVLSLITNDLFCQSLELARGQYAGGAWAEARATCLALVAGDASLTSQTEEARAIAASCLYKLADYEGLANEVAAFARDYGQSEHLDDLAYFSAQSAYETADWPRAEAGLRAYLATYPDSQNELSAGYYLAVSCKQTGKLEESSTRLAQLLAEAGQSGLRDSILLNLAEVEAALGHRAKARERFATLIAEHPESPNLFSARMALARLAFEDGDPQDATAQYQALLDSSLSAGQRETVLKEKADTHHLALDHASSIATYQLLIEEFPQSSLVEPARFAIAKGLYHQGKYAQASDALSQCIVQFPQSVLVPEAIYIRARAAYRRDDWAAAQEQLSRFLNDYPQAPERAEAVKLLAQAAYYAHDWGAFDEASAAALETGGSTGAMEQVKHLQARSLIMRHDWVNGAEALGQWLAEYPQGADALASRYLLGRALIESAPLRQPEIGEAAAVAMHAEGRARLAEFLAETSEAGQGMSETQRAWLARARLDASYYLEDFAATEQMAREYLERHSALDRPSAYVTLMLGISRTRLDPPDLAGASAAFDRIVESGFEDAYLNEHLPTHALSWKAAIAEKQGDADALRSAVERIRDEMPAGPVRSFALERYGSALP